MKQASIFSHGMRDTTTKESFKLDKKASILNSMKKNPNWKPLDQAGYKLELDTKTNDLKRVGKNINNDKKRSSTMMLMGDDAIIEYRKPVKCKEASEEEFERLISMNKKFDPNMRYVMDSIRAETSQEYSRGWSKNISPSNVEYDKETHMASKSGYKIFKSGIGFVHTNGPVSVVSSSSSDDDHHKEPCKCGFIHV